MLKYYLILMFSLTLLACGQKGNLYMPEEEPETPATTDAPKVDPVPEVERRDTP
jgi:predicted small lipoprotein YifL